MRVGLAQMRPTLGCFNQNIEKHIQLIKQAEEKQVDLLIFPELSLTGYQLLDLTYQVAKKRTSEEIHLLIEQADQMDVLFGFVEHSPEHQLYNSAIYASHRKLVHLHRKIYLPTYGMFDEARYFGRGSSIRSFRTQFGQFGLLICEDAWHYSLPYLLVMDGAELVIVISNSPVNGVAVDEPLTRQKWKTILTSQAMIYGSYILFVNRVGTEEGLSFYGGSFVVDPFGQVVAEAELFQEEVLTVDLDLDQVRQARFQLPIMRDENIHFTLQEMQRILQRQVQVGGKDDES